VRAHVHDACDCTQQKSAACTAAQQTRHVYLFQCGKFSGWGRTPGANTIHTSLLTHLNFFVSPLNHHSSDDASDPTTNLEKRRFFQRCAQLWVANWRERRGGVVTASCNRLPPPSYTLPPRSQPSSTLPAPVSSRSDLVSGGLSGVGGAVEHLCRAGRRRHGGAVRDGDGRRNHAALRTHTE
jgi:hypothetical protein